MLTARSAAELVDLAHRLDLPDEAWLRALGAGLAHAIGADQWTCAFGRFVPKVRLAAAVGTPGTERSWRVAAGLDSPTNAYLAQQGPVFRWPSDSTAQAAIGAERADAIDRLRKGTGFAQLRSWVAIDPAGAGLIFASDVADAKAAALREVLPVVLHAGAAGRLRTALDAATEAVIAPDGNRVLHAEGIALDAAHRDALKLAVRSIDKARGARSAYEALVAREVLVSGRWFLVDAHESDGRRYVVARVNEPIPAARVVPEVAVADEEMALYLALGHSAKQIAYELGVSPSTVSRALARVTRALGARSRPALVSRLVERVRAQLGTGEVTDSTRTRSP